MRQSNTYIIIFSIITTIILGGLLSLTSVGLAERQQIQVELDTKKSILRAVMDIQKGDDVLGIYGDRIESLVVDHQGTRVENDSEGVPLIAENVSIEKNFKLDPEERLYPVFQFKGDNGEIDAYILPIYGNGLWDVIWGYLALDKDLNTIKGVVFDHRGETPGLGARISEKDIQSRFVEKQLYDQAGQLISVSMLKGEGNPPESLGVHSVDGLAGATITARGVNNMIKDYLSYYENYLKKISS
ncbi:MAG: NADH:ubiquinone reductase (Na(+)-transporting) subunit C [Cyclobacteriaceae bacterium]|nr:NADH:ubiquinone reductase (Na(+)-transporting) subunit C [Cyclobacteriaceae bacterium]